MSEQKPLTVNELIVELHKLKTFPVVINYADVMKIMNCSYSSAIRYTNRVRRHLNKGKKEFITLEEYRTFYNI